MRKDQRAALQTIWNMVKGDHETLAEKKRGEKKPSFYDFAYAGEMERLPRSTPECQGISSARTKRLVEELACAEDLDMHHFMMVSGGSVIAECHFGPYQGDIWHVTYSMCKSITGMAVGMLAEEGKISLDDSIFPFFEERRFIFGKIRRKDLTIRNLLTMTSTVAFKEAGMVLDGGWVKEYLGAPLEGEPGEKFDYNSMNTYLLSAIVTVVTGQTLCEYLRPRLWEPLGIRKVWWETCPDGITKGGWGLYLCAEDMAKLGQMYLQKGQWNGVQIIPEWWVEESTARQADVPIEGAAGYGYQVWLGEHPGSYIFNGMFGQNVAVYPEWELVIVTCAGNNELFQEGRMFSIIDRNLQEIFSEQRKEESPFSYGNFLLAQERIQRGRTVSPAAGRSGWNKHSRRQGSAAEHGRHISRQNAAVFLRDKSYILEENNVGLLPVILQVLHNNYAEGIKKIRLYALQGNLYLDIEEGGDCNTVRIGWDQYCVSEIIVKEEAFLVAVKGELKRNEDDILVLKLTADFLEEAVSRELKILFRNEEAEMRWDETPGLAIIRKGFGIVFAEFTEKKLLQSVSDYGSELFELLAEKILHPITKGRLQKEQENKR